MRTLSKYLVAFTLFTAGCAAVVAVGKPTSTPPAQALDIQPHATLAPAPTSAPHAASKHATSVRRSGGGVRHYPVAVPVAYHPMSTSPASKVALLVGISNAPGADPLPGSKTDVETMRSTLLKYGFPSSNITVLLEGQATRGAILNALDNIAARSVDGGTAVVSITTHSSNSGSQNSMRAWDGRVYANELGSRLGRVRGRLWTLLPTCYSGGYAVPGVVGNNRIAVFSSSSDERSWQVGEAGSWVVRYMVEKGMLGGGAPASVESAFNYAVRELKKDAPDRVPLMRDGVSGDMVLGSVNWLKPVVQKVTKPVVAAVAPASTPEPTPTPANGGLLGGLFGLLGGNHR